MARRYEDYGARESAAIIVKECILTGESSGWCGGSVIDEVREICAEYGVQYVSDWTGTWAHGKR